MSGDTVLEFGSNGCGICRSPQRVIGGALGGPAAGAPLRHLKIEDGPGQPLGRSFGVKLWPTLVMLRDGREVARVVRPRSTGDVRFGYDVAIRIEPWPMRPPRGLPAGRDTRRNRSPRTPLMP